MQLGDTLTDGERLAELLSRAAPNETAPSLRASLFDRQRQFLEQSARRKVGVIGRRGGKSTIAAVALAESGMDSRPGVSFYCGITRERAKSIMWGPLKVINAEHNLGLKMNDSELIAYGPGDARIQLTGADKMKEADKKRGDKYKIAIIDEAGLFESYLEEMVREVLNPALMDYNAPLWLLGSPNKSCLGYFHDAATTLPGWQRFHWTAQENPHVDAEKFFREQADLYGLSRDDPAFQREYLGLWVKGGASMLYKFDATRNCYDTLAKERDWFYTIGVDLGFNDDTAFVVWAYEPEDPTLYEVECFKAPHMTPDKAADVLERLRLRWSEQAKIVVDTGGGASKMVEEGFRERFGSNVVPAKKTEKLFNIDLMNGDLVAGRIKVRHNSPIIEEWQALHLTEEGFEDPSVPNHLADAALYGYRYAKQFLWQAPEPKKAIEDEIEGYLIQEQEENERMESYLS